MSIRPRRSLLYMPGSNARALDKARSLPADGLILDLEDAVAPDAKALAREQIVAGARKSVDEMLAKLGIKAEVHVDSAEPVSYIRDVADRSYADVLVIGRAPKGGVLSGLREHSYAIVREAPCPVISV